MVVFAATPSLTPAPTATAAALELRATTSLDYGCYGMDALLTCDNGMGSCINNMNFANSDYYTSITSCYCRYGIGYLDCYFSALSQSNCLDYYSISDWGSYETEWFSSMCGSIPASVMARMTPPATVNVDFESVTIVHLNQTVAPTPHTSTPTYKGSGSLLAGYCQSTQYTLVDFGGTIGWAPFVGCISDKPECCPWTAASTMAAITPTADTTITLTSTVGGDGGQVVMGAYPSAQDKDEQMLGKCPDDYYSLSGGCCPNGYWPFTRSIGGAAPCWSSLNHVATPPTLTAGLAGQPTDTSKPTSAVVNIVWAMQYQVSSSSGSGLSTGAIAGIGVGGGVAAIAILTLAICLWRSKRKNKKLATSSAPALGTQPQPMVQNGMAPPQPGQGQMMMAPPMAPGMDNRTSIATSTTLPSMLVPQTTGTSGGGTVSDLSSTNSGSGLLNGPQGPGGGYFTHGNASPTNMNGQGYPPPIAEEPQQQGYFPQQPGQIMMQPHGQFYPVQQGGMYPPQPGMYQPMQQQPQFYQQQQVYQPPAVEVAANQDPVAPQEIGGTQVQYQPPYQPQYQPHPGQGYPQQQQQR